MMILALKNVFRTVLLTAALTASLIGCGTQHDEDAADEAQPEVAAQLGSAKDAGTKEPSAKETAAKAACALEFTECLASSWMKALSPAGLEPLTACVRDAEECGLFNDAPDAGTGVTPTCGFEIADCYVKNPRNPSKCQQLPCRGDATKKPTIN